MHGRAAQGAEVDDAPVARDGVDVLVEVARAHEVDDDVHALAFGELEHGLAPVLFVFIAEPLRRAEGFAELDLRGRARGDEDPARARGDAELDARDADAAGARVPEDAVAGFELADLKKRLGRGDPRLRDARADLPAQLGRFADEHVRAHGDVLGVRAAVREPEDRVAEGEVLVRALAVVARRVVGQGDDDAGELNAQRLGRLRGQRVVALALEQVHPVQAEGVDFDQGLGPAGLRDGEGRVDVQGADGAGVVFDGDGAHFRGDGREGGGHVGGGGVEGVGGLDVVVLRFGSTKHRLGE